jgi:D-alanyl-lipoteichoic acid acyltransferase DltB (MBOAT superfamily)
MLFNSIEFVLFFPLVLILYWGIFNRYSGKLRNLFLLTASYLFYGWWDYRFLGLIILSSVVDYFCGISIFRANTQVRKRLFMGISLGANLGVLFFFKYYGFFAAELASLLEQFGYIVHPSTLNIILPVGISFYTFQTLSYTIDIYRKRLQPTHDAVAFFTFVAFFPQLVAGPIERAKHLLPQFAKRHQFNYELASNGFRQLLWGFFAKVAVADSIAPIVDQIFANSETMSSAWLCMGAIFFAVQIYGDFSGYSNIAIGTASLLGFDLMQNFNSPYFSRNIREFWTRWHISLSTWFRDYVYIPLGGNRCSKIRQGLNVMTTFIISGLWHGANWTFLVWGAIHGLLYLITKPFSKEKKDTPIRINQLPVIFLTFALVCFAFIFFRAENISQAFQFIARIIRIEDGISLNRIVETKHVLVGVFFSAILFCGEWIQRDKRHGLDIGSARPLVRYVAYYFVILSILFAFQTDRIFIYFQF